MGRERRGLGGYSGGGREGEWHNRLKSDCTPSSLSAILESATIHLTSFAAVSGTPVTSLSGFSNQQLKWDIVSREKQRCRREENSSQ